MPKVYTIGKMLDILSEHLWDGYMDNAVKKPMAYALYKTWQQIDADEREKIEIKAGSSDDV